MTHRGTVLDNKTVRKVAKLMAQNGTDFLRKNKVPYNIILQLKKKILSETKLKDRSIEFTNEVLVEIKKYSKVPSCMEVHPDDIKTIASAFRGFEDKFSIQKKIKRKFVDVLRAKKKEAFPEEFVFAAAKELANAKTEEEVHKIMEKYTIS